MTEGTSATTFKETQPRKFETGGAYKNKVQWKYELSMTRSSGAMGYKSQPGGGGFFLFLISLIFPPMSMFEKK